MSLKCCANCFSNEWLRGYVHENSRSKGSCDYCGHKRVEIIPVDDLYDLFENLMNLYVPSNDPSGELVIFLIQCDYDVFEDALYTSGRAAPLLKDMMQSGWDDDAGEPPFDVHELYYRRESNMAAEWEE